MYYNVYIYIKYKDIDNLVNKTFVSHFLQKLLKMLLMDDGIQQNIIVSSAPCLAYMFYCEASRMNDYVKEIIPIGWSEDQKKIIIEKILNNISMFNLNPFVKRDRRKFSDYLLKSISELRGLIKQF